MTRKSWLFSWLMILMLGTALATTPACNKVHITDTPQGVIDKEVAAWYEATGALKTVSDAALGLTKAAVDLHPSGVYPNDEIYTKTLTSLGKIHQVGIQASNFLQQTPQHFDTSQQTQLAAYLDQGLAVLDDATQTSLLQIKDPTKKQEIDVFTTSLRSALKTIFALVKPAGTPLPLALQGGK